jgi:hypothetical protein
VTRDETRKDLSATRNLKGFRLEKWNLELGICLEFGACDLEFMTGGSETRPYINQNNN